MAKLAIIGTAGRADDGKRLAADPERYLTRMLDAAREVSKLTGATELISGGAAWADHIAVLLFLEDPEHYSLELELPAKLIQADAGVRVFDDKGTHDFKSNPGAVSNHYHKAFTKAVAKVRPGFSSFAHFGDIEDVHVGLAAEVRLNIGTGFLERNLVVAAKAHHCLAMTFGNGKQLKDGGTAHTMSNFLAKRGHGAAYHLDLNMLKLWEGATV